MSKKSRNLAKPSPQAEERLRQFGEVAERLTDSLEELGVTEEMAMRALEQARVEVYQENYGELVSPTHRP